jgi:hypothetical protein
MTNRTVNASPQLYARIACVLCLINTEKKQSQDVLRQLADEAFDVSRGGGNEWASARQSGAWPSIDEA